MLIGIDKLMNIHKTKFIMTYSLYIVCCDIDLIFTEFRFNAIKISQIFTLFNTNL
jgi:hypothetical protein